LDRLLARPTEIPFGPAGPLSVTVPVEVAVPATVVGLRLTETRVGAVIVSVAFLLTPFKLAAIVALVELETPAVATVKVAVSWPAATVTDAGTVAAALLLPRLTKTPP
jgi:hypothetical protein